MGKEPQAKPWPFQGPIYWSPMFIWAGVLVFLWFVKGPEHPIYVLMVLGWTWLFAPGIAVPGMRYLPRRWFHVPAGERWLHRALGVPIFGRLLDWSGWNRQCAEPMRGFTGTKGGLAALEHSIRAGEIAHGASFLVHVLLAVAALFTEHPWQGALWMLLPGVPTHFCPAMLQRSLLLRLQPMLLRPTSQRTARA